VAGGLTAEDVAAAGERSPPSTRGQAASAIATRPPLTEPATTAQRVARRPPPRRRRGRVRLAARTLFALVVIGAVGAGLWIASRQVYFVGTNDAGLVTLYRGLPYDLPLGIHLYEQEYASGVPAGEIPSTRRSRVLDHSWRGRGDAMDLVRQLERGRLSG
jgi:hypothetical protein